MSSLLNYRYQVVESLAKGGFGETFLAIDTHMPSERKCVIKQLKPAVQSPVIPEWLKERFAKEAAILEELGEKHPQIPTLYAYFSQGGDFYLVQEWIEGETLTQIHQQQGNLSPDQVKEVLIGILEILDYVHDCCIIHRDIKPDNIIIRNYDKKPVLIDFGIVKETVATMIHHNGNTPYSVALGTPGYMASEQAAGRPIISSDLYSLGLTAVFLLTGKTPQYLATDGNTGEILWRKEVPDIKSSIGNVIDRAIRFHPRDRFSTAKEMLKALAVSQTSPTVATIAVGPEYPSLSTVSAENTTITNSPETEAEAETPWTLLALGSFLAASAIIGGLILGIMLGTKERSQPTSSPSVSPESPESIESPQPEFSQPTPRSPQPIRRPRRSQPSPTPISEPSVTPESKPSPTPTPEPSATPESKPSPTPTPKPSATPKAAPSPDSTPIPEPTQAVPIPVEPPPQVLEPKENTNEDSSEPPLVIPNIPPKPVGEKPPKEEENKYNIQKYFESNREQNESNIKEYFDSDRP